MNHHGNDRVAHWAILGATTLAIGLASCTAQVGTTPAPTTMLVTAAATPGGPGPTLVRSSIAGTIGEAGQYLAQSQGYFAQEGLTVDFVKRDTTVAFAILIAGQIDVAGNGVDPGLFSAFQRGVDFRIVATQASSEPNANGAFLVVRKDLIDNRRVQSYADLKGLKIGIPARGNSAEYVVAKAMEAGGLALNDADLVELNFPAMVTALGSQALDIGLLPEPLASVAVQNGSGVKWKGYADVVPGIQQTVVVFSPQFAAQRDVATRWMTAFIHGIRDYNDAFVKTLHRPQTEEALAPALSIQPNLFEGMTFAHIDPNGKLNVASLQELMNWYVRMGYLSTPVDLGRIVDPSYAEAAVAKLGPYQ
jgi:ABC-type nitrate/sulfonate/bicarbonate transport system substrate-binding protein